MVAIASGIIIAWPSTAASIPSGWVRETNLDAKYIRGADASGDADLTSVFGSDTHTHTSPSHTPTQNSHTHVVSDGGVIGGSLVAGSGAPAKLMAPASHQHVDFDSAAATATNQGVAITVDATSNDPPYKKVIFIKSGGTPTTIPNNAYAFFESDTLPAGWSRIGGDTYLKGADAAGDGGATGGNSSHSHTSPAHNHPQNAHSHGIIQSGLVDVVTNRRSTTGTSYALGNHTHSVKSDSQTATNADVTTTIGTTAAEPVYKKLNCILNGNAAGDLPNSIIALWGGANSAIPTNWARYTSMDTYFHKGANADGESNVTTGGSTQHNHTASDCQPAQVDHSHGWLDFGSTAGTAALGTGISISAASHSHSWFEGGSTQATNNAIGVTINNCASEAAYPKHAKVIFVQFTTPLATSAIDPYYPDGRKRFTGHPVLWEQTPLQNELINDLAATLEEDLAQIEDEVVKDIDQKALELLRELESARVLKKEAEAQRVKALIQELMMQRESEQERLDEEALLFILANLD